MGPQPSSAIFAEKPYNIYYMTITQWEDYFTTQNEKCASCGKRIPQNKFCWLTTNSLIICQDCGEREEGKALNLYK